MINVFFQIEMCIHMNCAAVLFMYSNYQTGFNVLLEDLNVLFSNGRM